eukprot:Gb_05321 [translate_table: standard]
MASSKQRNLSISRSISSNDNNNTTHNHHALVKLRKKSKDTDNYWIKNLGQSTTSQATDIFHMANATTIVTNHPFDRNSPMGSRVMLKGEPMGNKSEGIGISLQSFHRVRHNQPLIIGEPPGGWSQEEQWIVGKNPGQHPTRVKKEQESGGGRGNDRSPTTERDGCSNVTVTAQTSVVKARSYGESEGEKGVKKPLEAKMTSIVLKKAKKELIWELSMLILKWWLTMMVEPLKGSKRGVLLLQKPPPTTGVEGKPFWRCFEVVEIVRDLAKTLS